MGAPPASGGRSGGCGSGGAAGRTRGTMLGGARSDHRQARRENRSRTDRGGVRRDAGLSARRARRRRPDVPASPTMATGMSGWRAERTDGCASADACVVTGRGQGDRRRRSPRRTPAEGADARAARRRQPTSSAVAADLDAAGRGRRWWAEPGRPPARRMARPPSPRWAGWDAPVNNAGVLQVADVVDITVEGWDRTCRHQRALDAGDHPGGGARPGGPPGPGGSSTWRAWGRRWAPPARRTTRRRRRRWRPSPRCARRSSARTGSRSTALCPGYVLTEMGEATRTPEMVAALGRPARPWGAWHRRPTWRRWPCSWRRTTGRIRRARRST